MLPRQRGWGGAVYCFILLVSVVVLIAYLCLVLSIGLNNYLSMYWLLTAPNSIVGHEKF